MKKMIRPSDLIDWVVVDFNMMGLSKRDLCDVLVKAVFDNRLKENSLYAYEAANWLAEDALEILRKDIKVTIRMRIRRLFLYPVYWVTLIGLRILSGKKRKERTHLAAITGRILDLCAGTGKYLDEDDDI
jgi:hypothetical protein